MQRHNLIQSAVIATTLLLMMRPTSAAQYFLDGVDQFGNPIHSGWAVEIPPAMQNNFQFVFWASQPGQILFDTQGLFPTNDPLNITFTRVSSATLIPVIHESFLTLNSTGVAWSGFKYQLTTSYTGNLPDVTLAASDGGNLSNWPIDPFTSYAFYNDNTALLLTGGTVPDGTYFSQPNYNSMGLAILANPNVNTFTFSMAPVAAPEPGVALLTGASVFLLACRRR